MLSDNGSGNQVEAMQVDIGSVATGQALTSPVLTPASKTDGGAEGATSSKAKSKESEACLLLKCSIPGTTSGILLALLNVSYMSLHACTSFHADNVSSAYQNLLQYTFQACCIVARSTAWHGTLRQPGIMHLC